MALRITADSLDELPEGLRAKATQEGGAYVVAGLSDGWAIEDVAGLRGALQSERGARNLMQKLTDALGYQFDGATGGWSKTGVDPREAVEAMEAVRSGKVKSNDEIERYRESIRETFAAEKKALEKERDSIRSQLENVIVRDAAYQALTTAGAVSPKVMLPMLQSMARVERDGAGNLVPVLYDDTGKPILSRKAGANGAAATFDEFVDTLRGSDEYRPLFNAKSTGGSGGGSQAGGSGRVANQALASASPEERLAHANRQP